jgi:hypothetical protein
VRTAVHSRVTTPVTTSTLDVLLSRDKYVHQVRPSELRDDDVNVHVSLSFHRGRGEVRWRDASGCRRARRFPD